MIGSFTTTTRILRGFSFFANYVFSQLNLAGITKFKYEKKNEKDSGRSSKMTSSCKWPIGNLKKKTHSKLSNYSGLPVEMQLQKAIKV